MNDQIRDESELTAAAAAARQLRVYVAGAWVEQRLRAKVMIGKLQSSGHVEITCDWTQAEGEAQQATCPQCSGSGYAGCPTCRGKGKVPVKGDSMLSKADRLQFATADLEGVLTADLVWLMAPSDKGACGSWVELGAALAARSVRQRLVSDENYNFPAVVVSGPQAARSIFTELANIMFKDDEEALQYVLHRAEEHFNAPFGQAQKT